MAGELSFEEPHTGRTVTLRTVPVHRLTVVGHQRKARPAHVQHLVTSIERIGFIVPVVAVEADDEGYVVIDGQHRLAAAKEVGLTELPVLVVPAELAPRMMNLNVEKDLNIREKSTVALGIYRSFVQDAPDLAEDAPEMVDALDAAHYVTLGLAYERPGRLAGSAFEPLLKKCDVFLDRPVSACVEIREGRADRVVEASEALRAVIDKAKEIGAYHQYLQNQVLASADPYKRKRGPVEFDDMFEKVTARLQKFTEDPERLFKLGGG